MRRQCAKCPWKVSTDPHDIPNGYDEKKHKGLSSTIAAPADFIQALSRSLQIMACHETHDLPCVGWLAHQLGPGNNLGLRMQVIAGHIDAAVETVGEQHGSLEETLPCPD